MDQVLPLTMEWLLSFSSFSYNKYIFLFFLPRNCAVIVILVICLWHDLSRLALTTCTHAKFCCCCVCKTFCSIKNTSLRNCLNCIYNCDDHCAYLNTLIVELSDIREICHMQKRLRQRSGQTTLECWKCAAVSFHSCDLMLGKIGKWIIYCSTRVI